MGTMLEACWTIEKYLYYKVSFDLSCGFFYWLLILLMVRMSYLETSLEKLIKNSLENL